MSQWWQLTVGEISGKLECDTVNGLATPDARARLLKYGPNQLHEEKGEPAWKLFADQFNDFIIWVLIGAAIISGFLGEWVDALAIIAIVLLNAVLGFIQEFRAEKSLAALKKLASPNSKVIRNAQHESVPSADLVPGDLVELEAGDNVPADSRVISHTANFSVQEASLTGESTAVHKNAAPIPADNPPLADRTNLLFMGTSVTSGKARALIIESGMRTELGKIAGMLQAVDKEMTPLQKKLEQFGKWLVYLCGLLVFLVFCMQLFRGYQAGGLSKETIVEMFLTAVSLAVAAIPEGLPAVVTIALALGLHRMVKRNALIRKLPSVETLGCASVICSDKTGTLTRNEMTVQAVYAGGRRYSVTGVGYAPNGGFLLDGKAISADDHPDLRRALQCGVLCNGAGLSRTGETWTIVGDPTEGALLSAALKAGIGLADAERQQPLVEEIPFDSERKMMTMLRRDSGAMIAYVKGAPDVLAARCVSICDNGAARPMTDADRCRIMAENDALAEQAMRVLAVAVRPFAKPPASYDAAVVERDLVFAGLVAMIDPAREEVRHAIEQCKTAGIRTVMITGDHKKTAVAIARSLGFFSAGDQALSGEDLDGLSADELAGAVERTPVYARVSPEHKLRIVKAWRSKGRVVAMTGDGVNDAPAVKEADIGVAMGITGTDVTKEVSDMVVTDDNFTSIVAAVEEGRGIYDNIQKFIHYLLSCNAGEILVMFLSSLFGMPIPLLPVQLLWINLVTDGLPALALGVDPVDRNIMMRSPRSPDESVVSSKRLLFMVGQGAVIAFCSLAAFTYVYYLEGRATVMDAFGALFAGDGERLQSIFTIPAELRETLLARARTMGFVVLAFSQDFHSYNCRNQTESLFKIGVFSNRKLVGATLVSITFNMMAIYNPFFQTVLKTQPLSGAELALVLLFASTPFWAMEIFKVANKVFFGGRMRP
jgi:Ca2+-transporting ATPase